MADFPFQHYPQLFDPNFYQPLLQELSNFCQRYKLQIRGKEYPSRRMSCTFGSSSTAGSALFSYGALPNYTWEQAPLVQHIRDRIMEWSGMNFDFVLAHIYVNGHDNIAWHHDKEAIDGPVISVSFGATRIFRIRPYCHKNNEVIATQLIQKYQQQGISFPLQFHLGSGDVFYMFPGCQRYFEHSVPEESYITEPRINLTFRIKQ